MAEYVGRSRGRDGRWRSFSLASSSQVQTTMKPLPVLGLVILLGSGLPGCGDAPRMVNMAPPGIQQDILPPELKNKTSTAIGETGLPSARAVEDRAKPLDLLDPTEPGQEVALESGLKYKTLKAGPPDAPVARSGSRLSVHYTGKLLIDGTQFDSSRGKDPLQLTLGLGAVIEGWEQGLAGMHVGEIRELVIPASLAYADQRRPGIPPNSALVFEVELLDVQGGADNDQDAAPVVTPREPID